MALQRRTLDKHPGFEYPNGTIVAATRFLVALAQVKFTFYHHICDKSFSNMLTEHPIFSARCAQPPFQ